MLNAPSYGDLFLLQFDGNTRSNGSGMHVAWVQVTKNSSSSAFTVVDWSPKSNYGGNCSTQTIGVSYIFSWSMNVTMCEWWTVYADPINRPGLQITQWSCPLCTVYNDLREETILQEVQTAKNKSPIWNLYYDFT
jgi:predicted Co/Zn/Cd cation transporter (cation efflux family)